MTLGGLEASAATRGPSGSRVARGGARGARGRAVRRPDRRRRDRRRRGAARRDEPRAPGRARRAARHRVGHVRAVVPPDPRRPALPGAAPLRARLRGARGAGAAAPARAAPRDPGAVPLPDLRHPAAPPGLLRQRHLPVRPARRAARRRLREAPPAVERDRVRAGPAAQGPDRRDHLPRRGRGRRPAGARGAPDGARRRAPSRRRGSSAEQPLLDGERLIGATVARPRQRQRRSRSAPSASSTRPASGRRTRRRDSPRSRAPTRSSRAAARTSSSAATASRRRAGSRSGSRAASCSSSRGRATGSSAPRTTPDPRRPEHVSAPDEDVDELLETVNRQIDIDLSRGDIVGTYAGHAAARRRPRRLDRQGVARASGRRGRERPRPDLRRQVHDLPGDGPRRRRRVARAGRRPSGAGRGPADLPLVGAAPRDELDADRARASSGRCATPRRRTARRAPRGRRGSRAGSRIATGARRRT